MEGDTGRRTSAYAKLTCIVVFLVLANGCASTRPTPYKSQPIDSYKNVQTKNGLAVAVVPILDGEESSKHFGADLPSNSVIPAYVIVENRHPSLNFVLSRDRILLSAEQFEATSTPEKTASTTPDGTAPPSKGTRSSGWDGVGPVLMTYPPVLIAVLVATPFILISDQRRKNREEVGYHLRTQEFQNRTLAPGQSAGGFVYFQLPREAKLPAHWAIRLDGLVAGSQEITRFEFRFGSEKETR